MMLNSISHHSRHISNLLHSPPPHHYHHHHHHHQNHLIHHQFIIAMISSISHSKPKAHYHHDKLSSSSSSLPLSSVSAPPLPPDSSLTVDFLMESGGLSYEQAIQVILKKPTLLKKGGRKPRLVIAYFESIGFSKTHISKAISKCPRLLVSDVENTFKPKIQLLQLDFGFPDSDIVDLIVSKPSILLTSLENQIKPSLELIKSFVKTDADLIKAIKRPTSLFLLLSIHNRNSIEPNMDVLRHHGVPDSEILHLILTKLNTLMSRPEVFKRVVQRIVRLGFKPGSCTFSEAVSVMSGMKKITWDSKIDLLKGSLGWSDEHILDAFRKSPAFLRLSRENLKESIEFYVETMNWDTSILSHSPSLLGYSLKRRVIPRLAVFKCLMSKDIIEDDKLFIAMLKLTETQFLSTYVFKYQQQLPYLYEVYNKEDNNGEITNQQEDHGDVTV